MTALPNNEVASKGCSQAVIALTAAKSHTAQRKHRKMCETRSRASRFGITIVSIVFIVLVVADFIPCPALAPCGLLMPRLFGRLEKQEWFPENRQRPVGKRQWFPEKQKRSLAKQLHWEWRLQFQPMIGLTSSTSRQVPG